MEIVVSILVVWIAVIGIETTYLHIRYEGRMKRGAKLWSEPLPEDMKRFLRRLPGDLVDSRTSAFIRKENNTVLVQYRRGEWPWERGATLSYMGYIDLRVREPRIEYRVPISPLPFFFIWIAGLVWVTLQDPAGLLMLGFGGLMFCFVHTVQRDKMWRFIREKMSASRVSRPTLGGRDV